MWSKLPPNGYFGQEIFIQYKNKLKLSKAYILNQHKKQYEMKT